MMRCFCTEIKMEEGWNILQGSFRTSAETKGGKTQLLDYAAVGSPANKGVEPS